MESLHRLRPFNGRTRSLQQLLIAGLLTAFFSTTNAQSLDEAVNAQLQFIDFGCDRLLNGDPNAIDDLQGELAVICQRGSPSSGDGSSSTAGGGAGTAANRPEAVRQRLDDDGEMTESPAERGLFLSVFSGISDRSVTRFQDGYDSDIVGVAGGFDFAFDQWIAGFAVNYAKHDGQFLGGGNFSNRTVGLTAFGSRSLGERTNVDFYAGYNSNSNERVRNAAFVELDPDGALFFARNGQPEADFDSNQSLAGIQLSYGVPIGNVTIGPRVAVDWHKMSFDTYAETESSASGLALTFHDDERTSLMSSVGIDGSVAISTNFGVVMISEYFEWRHEFEDNQRDVQVSFVDDTRGQRFTYQTDPPDRDYFNFGISLTLIAGNDFHAFVAYERMDSHDFLDGQTFNLGIRKGF